VLPSEKLTAATTLLSAPFAIGVAVGTSFTTEILSILFHGISNGNNAQARFAGTFH
jgi:hypothetical protein